MKFQHEHGRYFLTDDQGHLTAEVTYTSIDEGHALSIDHTFVDPSLRGQGIAGQLVRRVVDHARHHDLKIEPLCTFARAEFQRRPEYADVLRHTAAERHATKE
ncbi:GNAT family N-acetyltransferase [Lacticaseibacillus thailandensis]|uniref:Uncharacterized protein n=1 Tax=Lacticaseibacillus thailandensis DSM 22698 = JCM 13996 TaxID=1423810 RepID=A0A0R2CEE3_9LACO|nr:GNAT family N-acetyltransferase [Lacticaseibacillus thailandensis]KRM86492.1 hypothetical protein FD19_GL001922 [Lacticaseibacillus thailandensis DSM 22698 = JCM 13996]